jgi:hypothetical protein
MTASNPVAAKAAPTVFRPLDGVLLLDKPAGMSSNQALQRVRHLFRAEKAGHTGSLDPLATGLLPVCFGEATKVAGLLLGHRKAYETEARLGATTDTDDADGVVLRERPVPVLASGRDGLDAIREIVRDAPAHLVRDGWLLLEHGLEQGCAVRNLLDAAGFVDVATEHDLEGRDRVTLGRMSE